MLFVLSYLVEGGRQARNRLVTSLVVTAFLIALIPLVSPQGWDYVLSPYSRVGEATLNTIGIGAEAGVKQRWERVRRIIRGK